MSYKLEKPYSIKKKADFIVKYNHNNGLLIQETDTALYALEAWELLEGDTVVDNTEAYEAEQAQKETERKALLHLTAADVERAIYKVKGIDFEDIIALIAQLEVMPLAEGQKPLVDIKALKIELKANNFYRGNPYVNVIGGLLGFTTEQLDEFFETGDYTKLMTTNGDNPSPDENEDTTDENP